MNIKITPRYLLILTNLTVLYLAIILNHEIVNDKMDIKQYSACQLEIQKYTIYAYIYIYLATSLLIMVIQSRYSPGLDDHNPEEYTTMYDINMAMQLKSARRLAHQDYKFKLGMAIIAISSHMLAQSNSLHMGRGGEGGGPPQARVAGCHSSIPYSQIYSSRTISNKLIKSYNGNIDKTGIKILSWNKGSSHLINTIDNIKQLIQDEKPLILAIQEANILPGHNLDDLKIEDYKLYRWPPDVRKDRQDLCMCP